MSVFQLLCNLILTVSVMGKFVGTCISRDQSSLVNGVSQFLFLVYCVLTEWYVIRSHSV